MSINRREILGAAGIGAASIWHPDLAVSQTPAKALKPPLFGEPKRRAIFAGFRPVRANGFRLECTPSPKGKGQVWINNYGHGGGGITLSWGCATQVADWVSSLPPSSTGRLKVVVLGAGVIGLTTAKLLLERLGPSCELSVHADQITGRNVSSRGVGGRFGTTSDNAGGQFEPSFSAWRTNPIAQPQQSMVSETYQYSDQEIIRISYNRFMADQAVYPVSLLPNYLTLGSELSEPPATNGLMRTQAALLSSTDKVPRVSGYPSKGAGPVQDLFIGTPLAVQARRGIPCNYMIPTLLIEVPKLMGSLRQILQSRLHQERFSSREAVLSRFSDADVIVNCLGCDGGMIAGYPDEIHPKLGVVLGLPPLYRRQASSSSTNYLYGGLGYIFARGDHTIVGGWKKDFRWSEYKDYDLIGGAHSVGQELDYYMHNFVLGNRQAGRILPCFTNDGFDNLDNFVARADPDNFLEMDGNHTCNDDPLRRGSLHRRISHIN